MDMIHDVNSYIVLEEDSRNRCGAHDDEVPQIDKMAKTTDPTMSALRMREGNPSGILVDN